MSRTLLITLCLLATTVATTGCTTARALRHNTVSQANTVADIHQQQVLDNLAKFVHDPYAIPSFAVANAGTTSLTDAGDGALGLAWNNTRLTEAGVGFGASRTNDNTWTTTAINDPRRLELMRCAYQRAIATCGLGCGESTSCPDCRKRFNQFYTGRASGVQLSKNGGRCNVCEDGRIANQVSPPYDDPCVCQQDACEPQPATPGCPACEGQAAADCPSPGSGTVNSECLVDPCWFCYGCKKCVPKHCRYVGHHCGTYVWVPCGPGRDALAKLTLAILDYAVNEPAQRPRKTVYAMLDQNGDFADSFTQASMIVSAEVSVDELSRSAVKPDLDFGNFSVAEQAKEKQSTNMQRYSTMDQEFELLEAIGAELSKQQKNTGNDASPLMKTLDSRTLDVAEMSTVELNQLSSRAAQSNMTALAKKLNEYSLFRANAAAEKAARMAAEKREAIRRLPTVESIQPRTSSGAGGGGLLQLQQLLETVD